MKVKEIQNIVELLKLAKISKFEDKKEERRDLKELEATQFKLPENMENILPIISVDGSYCFLFSFLGAETWIILFRIGVTEYSIEINNGAVHYIMNSKPKVYDHLNLISFNKNVLSSQPKAFSIAANINKSFSERNPQYFASNIMTYLEDLTLEKISKTRKDCILLKDGALLSFKSLEREPIYKSILQNCRDNDILLAGVSKSTSNHLLDDFYTDDYFLKRYYNKKYADLTYIPVPKKILEVQTRFDIWGEAHFVKLHKKAVKWFRIDILPQDRDKKDQLFSSIAAYSMVHLMPGYPIGLIECHKIAKSARDLKNTYELELIESLKKLGLEPKDILEGAVDMNGRELYSFHEILDQQSR